MSVLDTWLCVLSSCAAGIGSALFGCILSWADHVKRRNGGKHTRKSHIVAILGVIGSTIFGFSSLVGLYFGPVTLVVVIRAGSLLPANALLSQLFDLRPLTRDDYLGTVVTISGVVCFSIFGGPPAQSPSEPAFLEMMSWTGAIICDLALGLIFVGSLSALLLVGGGEDNMGMALAVTNVGSVSSAFMDLAAKGWSAALSRGVDHAWASTLFWASLGMNVVFLISMRVAMIYGCKRCDVLLFVPLNTVLNIFYSVLAGMVILQEYKQVFSWPGIVAASTSVLGGVIMLVSGPAVHPDRQDGPLAQAAADKWSSDTEEEEPVSDIEALYGPHRSRLTGSMDADRLPGTATTRRSPARDASGSAPLPDHDDDDDLEDTSEGLVVSSEGFLASIAHGLRPDVVRLNSVHREAAKAKLKWKRMRQRLRKLVYDGEESDDETRSRRLSDHPKGRGPLTEEEDEDSEESGSESVLSQGDRGGRR